MDSNAEVQLDATNGAIEIFVLGDLDLKSNSTMVTPLKSAVGVTINLCGDSTQEALLRSNSDFYGRIYGPDALVDIRSNFELYGAVLADVLVMNSNCKVHYDEALRGSGSGYKYVPGKVSPVPFPNRTLLVNRKDPFLVLGLDPANLPLPDEAHEMP